MHIAQERTNYSYGLPPPAGRESHDTNIALRVGYRCGLSGQPSCCRDPSLPRIRHASVVFDFFGSGPPSAAGGSSYFFVAGLYLAPFLREP